MKVKELKQARIRYEEANPEKKGTIAETEGFCLEIWDEADQTWGLVCKVDCLKSTAYPDEKENNFINWQILKEITALSTEGYTISYRAGGDQQ